MGDLTLLELVLLVLMVSELTLFFILNGSDFGVGIATAFVKDSKQKTEMMRVPIPVLFGNETWLVVGLAVMFGAFPHWYASLASGYYLVFILVLVFLILRALALNYRTRWQRDSSNRLMDILLFVGSLLPPFLLALVFSSTLQGVPLTGEIVYAGFFDIVTPFTVWSGITMVLMCWSVGLARVIKFVEGDFREYLRAMARRILYLLFGALVVEVVLLFVFTQVLFTNPLPIFLMLSLMVAGVVVALFASAKHIDRLYFWATIIPVMGLMATLFIGLFPNAIVDTGGNSLSIAATASGFESQLWVMGGSAVMLPLMVMGQLIAYYYMNRYFRVPDTDINT